MKRFRILIATVSAAIAAAGLIGVSAAVQADDSGKAAFEEDLRLHQYRSI